MIHFFFTYTDDASDTPFVRALVDAGIDHAVYTRKIDFSYKHRAQLLLLRMPALLWYCFKSVFWSLWRAPTPPSIVIPISHLQALLFVLARPLARQRYSIVLLSFIYTSRQNKLLTWLRKIYFKALLNRLDGIICHSEIEVQQYGNEFGCPNILRYVPLGLNVEGHETAPPTQWPGQSFAVSAGRSGRDYKTLGHAFAGLKHPLKIICDNKQATAEVPLSSNIQILDNCFGGEYLRLVRAADMVVVPIQVNDISAGQMVIIQAMALRKPIITTRTVTVGHYVKDEWNALLVEKGDAQQWQQAVSRLLNDAALSQRLSANAYQTFLESFSIPAFARAIVAVSRQLHLANRPALSKHQR